MKKVIGYVEAIGRNPGEENQHSHLYAIMEDGGYLPMCIYGWNRMDGERFSILRGLAGKRGLCGICQKRRDFKLPPLREGLHKTKWL